MKYLVLLFLLLPFAAHADPRFDSLFAKSHVVVIGYISRQNSEGPIREKKGDRHYINLKIEEVGLAGIPLTDSSGIFLPGDTLYHFSYISTNSDSMNPYGPVVLFLVRDAQASSIAWRMTDEHIGTGAFDNVQLFFDRCPMYYIDAGRGLSSRVENIQTATCRQRIVYHPNGKVSELTEYKEKATWTTYFDPTGRKIAKFRETQKPGSSGARKTTWCTWRNGHPALRRQSFRIID